MSDYILHPEAFIDLDEIWEFIAQDSPDAADRVREEIYRAIRELVPFPQKGHRRTDITASSLRFWGVRDYLIVYAPKEKPLLIVAVIHGSRSPRVMAAILRTRE